MGTVLTYDEVRAFYGQALIVDGLSFEVAQGECFALLGPNGVGKTTSLNAMFGIAQLKGGAISVGGRRLKANKAHEPSRLGAALVPQGRWIIGSLTIEENLLLGAASRRSGPWTLAKIYEMFPVLAERKNTPGTSLSGGQQQMLAIGRALMSNPQVLLLDEPSEGLAPVVIDSLIDSLRMLRDQGTSMLLIEQRLDMIFEVADRYAVMAKGEVVAHGSVAETSHQDLQDLVTL